MTRTQKISKLGNAIKAYRGLYDTEKKRWYKAPDSKQLAGVIRWLSRLGVKQYAMKATVTKIRSLATIEEYTDFMKYVHFMDTPK